MSAEHGTRTRYLNGRCRCPACREAKRVYEAHRNRMIAYGRWEHPVDATGTRRRLQALVWCGWSLARLSARLGGNDELARKILGHRRVTAATERAARVLYGELWDQAPPEDGPWDRRAAARARNYARRHGFVPPAAWDDDEIDDPAATPADGWERQGKRRYGVLAEEAVELTVLREHPEAIAVRLGVTPETVERTLQRAGQAPWRAAA